MSLKNKSWQHWIPDDSSDEDDSTPSTPPSGTVTPLSSQIISRSDEVMKLPKKDMKIFGQCPVQDDFLLVVCDICGRSVKLEAFEQHYRIRHGRSAVESMSSAPVLGLNKGKASALGRSRAAQNLKSCSVELSKEEFSSTSTSASSSTASTPSNSRANSVPKNNAQQQNFPSVKIVKEEPMETDNLSGNGQQAVNTLPKKVSVKVKEEDNISSNNVISIPDTDPLPHQMSNDLMAMVSGEISSGTTQLSVTSNPSTPASTQSLQINSSVIKLQLAPQQGVQLTNTPLQVGSNGQKNLLNSNKKQSGGKKSTTGRSERKPLREYHPDKHCGVWDNDSKRNCTRALTCKSHSVLLKRKIPGRSRPFDELVAEHKATKEAQAAAAAAAAASVSSSTTPATKLMPAPATIPQHSTCVVSSNTPSTSTASSQLSVLNVDDVLNSIQEPNVIEPSSRFSPQASVSSGLRGKLNPTTSQSWSPVSTLAGIGNTISLSKPVVASLIDGGSNSSIASASPSKRQLKEASDENLHYTNEHPKPLAVCNFGGKRIGGLYVTDRSQMVKRKVICIAIAANGLRNKSRSNMLARYHPVLPTGAGPKRNLQPRMSIGAGQQQGSNLNGTTNFVVNYNLSSPIGVSSNKKGIASLGSHRPGSVIGTRGSVTIHHAPPSNITSTFHTGSNQSSPSLDVPTITTSQVNFSPSTEVSFKTDIQDFKGGMKFELGGRRIKPILPSSDVT